MCKSNQRCEDLTCLQEWLQSEFAKTRFGEVTLAHAAYARQLVASGVSDAKLLDMVNSLYGRGVPC